MGRVSHDDANNLFAGIASTALAISGNLTVSAWYRIHTAGSVGFVEKTIAGAVNKSYLLFLSGGNVFFRILVNSGTIVDAVSASNSYTEANRLFAFSYNGITYTST